MNKKKLIACLTGIALFAGTLTGCAAGEAKTTETFLRIQDLHQVRRFSRNRL